MFKNFSGSENEKIIVPNEVQINGNNVQENSQSINQNIEKRSNLTPKIWMNFDDFCTCFTSIIIFHNTRGYQYNHKHTEIKV